MTQFKTHEAIEATVVLTGVWLWKLVEFLYKQTRSETGQPERFGYLVSLDVPFFVTIGLVLMFAVRALDRWYQGR